MPRVTRSATAMDREQQEDSTPPRSPSSSASTATGSTPNVRKPRSNNNRGTPSTASSSHDATDKSWYLDPSITPNKLTVNRLRDILTTHGVHYKSSMKKAELVALFETEVLKRVESTSKDDGTTDKNGRTDKQGKATKIGKADKNSAGDPDEPAQQPCFTIAIMTAIVNDALQLMQDVGTLAYHHPKLSTLLLILWFLYMEDVWNAWRFSYYHPKLSGFVFVLWLVSMWW